MSLYAWLSAALPFVFFIVLLLLITGKHLTERRQRLWMAGFLVILCVIAAAVIWLAAVLGTNAALLGASVVILTVGVFAFWRKRAAGSVLLDLGAMTTWSGSYRWWYGLAAFWCGVALLCLFTGHDLVWLAFCTSNLIFALVRSQERGRLEARERGLVLSSNGYLPWSRIKGYVLSDTTLSLRVRLWFGPSSMQTVLHCSPEQRRVLRQMLDRHIPATTDASPI